VLIIAAAIGASAFTLKQKPSQNFSPVWFQYTPVNGNGPTDPANYTETPGGPACSDETGVFCSVHAEPDNASGDPGERIPTAASLSSISSTYGFDDYVEGVVHMDDN